MQTENRIGGKGPYRIQSTSNLIGRPQWGTDVDRSAAKYNEVEFSASAQNRPPVNQSPLSTHSFPIPSFGHSSSSVPAFDPGLNQHLAKFPTQFAKRPMSLETTPINLQRREIDGNHLDLSNEPGTPNQNSSFGYPPTSDSLKSPKSASIGSFSRDFQRPTAGYSDSSEIINSPHRTQSFVAARSKQYEGSSFNLSDVRLRRMSVSKNGVHFSNLMLEEFPEQQVISIGNVEELDLSGNKLSNLPATISTLSKLRILNLSRNLFSLIPELGLLSSLVSINLGQNRIIRFPVDIIRLKRIEEVDISNNQIFEITPSFFQAVTNLRLLDLHGNLISTIPSTIENSARLQELNLNDNQIISLPEEMRSLTNLLVLEINNNRITNMPVVVAQMSSLVQLNAEHNYISVLPKEIGSMKSLSKLNIASNPLERQLADISKQGTFALLRYLRSSNDSKFEEDSLESLRSKISEQDKAMREIKLKHQAEVLELQEKLKESELKCKTETAKVVEMSARVAEFEIIMKENSLEPGSFVNLKKQNEDLINEREMLLIEIAEKEKQFNEASSRKNEILADAIKKIEDLVHKLKDLEEENRILVAEKNGLLSHLETQLSQVRDSAGLEKPRIEMIFRGVRESSNQLRICLNRLQGIGQQMNAILFRIEFNDQSASQCYRTSQPPSGDVTLVCIELFSPAFSWADNPKSCAVVTNEVNKCLRKHMQTDEGYEVFTVGHVNLVAFSTSAKALHWCLSVMNEITQIKLVNYIDPLEQTGLSEEHQNIPAVQLKIGVHEGKPEVLHNIVANRFDYLGLDVQIAFTLASCAHPGQILLTQNTLESAAKETAPESIHVTALPPCQFPGVETPIEYACVQSTSQPLASFPPLSMEQMHPSAAQQIILSLKIAQEEYTNLLMMAEKLEVDLSALSLGAMDTSNNPVMQDESVRAISSKISELVQCLGTIMNQQHDLRKLMATLEMEKIQPLLYERDHLAEKLSSAQALLTTLASAKSASRSTLQEGENTDESVSLDGSVTSNTETDSTRSRQKEEHNQSKSAAEKSLDGITQLVHKLKVSRFRTVDEANLFLRALTDKIPPKDQSSSDPNHEPTRERERKSTPASASHSLPSTISSTPTSKRGRTPTGSFSAATASSTLHSANPLSSPAHSSTRGSSKPPVPRASIPFK